MKRFVVSLIAASAACLAAVPATSGRNASKPPVEPPIMGWSSWNAFRVHISDSIIMKQADLMESLGLKDCGYRYINIDDGFFGHRDENGYMVPHRERFPKGMKCVADHIHSRGLKAGIYTDAGERTCGSMYDNDPNGRIGGMYGHDMQDITLYLKDWGYDFLKIDFCGGQKSGLDEQQRYKEIRRNIPLYSGRNDIKVNVCRWAYPGTWVREAGDSWRISGDIRQRWSSIVSIIEKNMYLSAYAGGGHYNDMDILVVGFADKTAPIGGETLSYQEEEAHFGMWCIMSSPLVIGCDLSAIPKQTLDMLRNRELIAVNQDPLGLQAYVVQHERGSYVFVKDLLQKRGKERAVALYNPTDSPRKISVPLSAIEFSGKVYVRDLNKRENLGTAKDSLQAVLPPHSAKILKVTGKRRIEPSLYEAEWAYLPCFDDISGRQQAKYIRKEGTSGSAIVSFIGGSEENRAEWNEVYSEKGGRYEMTVSLIPENGTRLEISVNGKKITAECPESGSGIQKLTVPVTLRKGFNSIAMGNPSGLAPGIDCFTLERK